jgi:hypothetical protein
LRDSKGAVARAQIDIILSYLDEVGGRVRMLAPAGSPERPVERQASLQARTAPGRRPPTSRRVPAAGRINRSHFVCTGCGRIAHADVNAAGNVLMRGVNSNNGSARGHLDRHGFRHHEIEPWRDDFAAGDAGCLVGMRRAGSSAVGRGCAGQRAFDVGQLSATTCGWCHSDGGALPAKGRSLWKYLGTTTHGLRHLYG